MTRLRRDVLTGIGIAAGATVGGGVVAADPDSESNPYIAGMRVVHLSPDTPAVDVVVDGSTAYEDVHYGAVTGYLGVDRGATTIRVTPAGDRSDTLLELDRDLGNGDYTFAVVGERSEGTLELLELPETGVEAPDRAGLQFVQASPDLPPADVTFEEEEEPLFEEVEFTGTTSWTTAEPGLYDLRVRPSNAGSDSFDRGLPLYLRPGRDYTVFANGYLTSGDEPRYRWFGLTPTEDGVDEPALARLSVVHAVPDVESVDVYLDGSRVASELLFGFGSGSPWYFRLFPGRHTLTVTVAGDESDVLVDTDLYLPDGDYTVAVSGERGTDTVRAIGYEDDLSDPGEDYSRLRYLHLSPDLGPVDVTYRDGEVAFEHLTFGEAASARAYAPTIRGERFAIREATPDNDGKILLEGPNEEFFEAGELLDKLIVGYRTREDEPGSNRLTVYSGPTPLDPY